MARVEKTVLGMHRTPQATLMAMIALAALGLGAALGWGGWLRAGEIPSGATTLMEEGPVRLVLRGALYQERTDRKTKEVTTSKPMTLLLETAYEDGGWERVLGLAPDFNRGHHRGRVLKQEATDEGRRLTIEMRINGDPWVPGGRAVYTLDLSRGGGVDGEVEDGASDLTGRFTGTFRKRPVAGTVTVEAIRRPKPPADHRAVDLSEHPRILFRKHDIPALKARRSHPVVAAAWKAIESSTDPVALGVLYQFTGDKTYADRAVEPVEKLMADRTPGERNLGHAWGPRLRSVALTYDLCQDAWEPAFRKKVQGYIHWITGRLIFRLNTISNKVNWSPNNNYHAFLRGGAAFGALAIAGDKGDKPTPPTDPGEEATPIEPKADFTPAPEAPVVAFEAGVFPTEWLWAGPFQPVKGKTDEAFDPVQVGPGTEATLHGATLPFEPIPTEHLKRNKAGAVQHFDLRKPTRDAFNHVVYFYTILDVPEAALVRLDGNGMNASNTYWLNGKPVREGSFLRLQPGKHPFFVKVNMGSTNDWGGLWFAPRFTAVSEEAMREEFRRRQESYRLARNEYEEDLATWEKHDGANPDYLYLQTLGRIHMAQYYRYCMGDGGYMTEGEGYTNHSNGLPLAYAGLYKRLFGHSVTGRPDASHFIPRYLMTMIPDGAGGHLSQSFSIGGLGAGGYPKAGAYARLFPAIAPEYQPAALWMWNTFLGLNPEGEGDPKVGGGLDAVYTFLHYPAEMKPEPPEAVMPKTWAATTKGAYIFRDGWKGPKDIVAQMFLKAEGEGGWSRPDAGSIRILGLGHTWATSGYDNPKAGYRWNEPVVMLLDENLNEGMRAYKLLYRAEEDGSGAITMDMKHLYMGAKTVQDAKGRERRGKLVNNAFQVEEENLLDLGIKGIRAFGVDYGGAAGVPAVFAVVDRIEGGGKKLWHWHLPTQKNGKAAGTVSVEGNRFTIQQGEATLVGTVIAPANAKVVHFNEKQDIAPGKIKKKSADTKKTVPAIGMNAIRVTGGENAEAGDFFVILTLQEGGAPPVRIDGAGLEATATIQDLQVRFADDALQFTTGE